MEILETSTLPTMKIAAKASAPVIVGKPEDWNDESTLIKQKKDLWR